MTRVLVTGAAGLIGYHLLARLLKQDHTDVRGCDSFTPYYDVSLKKSRSADLKSKHGFEVETVNLCEAAAFRSYFEEFAPEVVIHLAAQPGVRQGISRSRS